MGKNRKNNQNNTPQEYTSQSGTILPTDGHTQEWMQTLNEKIRTWLEYGGKTLQELTKEEKQYIQNHMQSTINDPLVENEQLTRVEKGDYFKKLLENGLKVGDKLETGMDLLSFTGRRGHSQAFARPRKGTVVIYRTNGDVKHYPTDKFTTLYDEGESLVNPQSLKVDKIQHMKLEDYDSRGDYTVAVREELGYPATEEDLYFMKKGVEGEFYQSDDVYFVDVSEA